jgi:hypothetical protein
VSVQTSNWIKANDYDYDYDIQYWWFNDLC